MLEIVSDGSPLHRHIKHLLTDSDLRFSAKPDVSGANISVVRTRYLSNSVQRSATREALCSGSRESFCFDGAPAPLFCSERSDSSFYQSVLRSERHDATAPRMPYCGWGTIRR